VKIVVVGGKRLIGAKFVPMLTRDGHEVVAASRRPEVDVVTSDELSEALQGASVVVDVGSFSSFEGAAVVKFFKTATHNLLA
jgi:uncharacterized protein YbjT (DUF2867 family)